MKLNPPTCIDILTYNFIGSIASCQYVLVTFDAVYVYVVKEKPIFIDDDILLGYSEAVVACYSAACRVSENVFIFFPLLLIIATEFSITVLKARELGDESGES